MATSLPLIRANVPPEVKRKMEFLATENDRSLSKEITQACRAWIRKYESENGEIPLKSD